MSSGDNNNPKQPNNLPAVSSSSLRVLGNQVQVLADVLKEKDPLYWYENAIKAYVANDSQKALYYCNKTILIDRKFSSAYLLKTFSNNRIFLKKNEPYNAEFYQELILSFQVNFIKSFIDDQFSTEAIFPSPNAFYDTEIIQGKDPIQYYYEDFPIPEIEVQQRNGFSIEKYFFTVLTEATFDVDELPAMQAESEDQSANIYLAIAVSCAYAIAEDIPKSSLKRMAKYLLTALDCINKQEGLSEHKKWTYLAASIFSQRLSYKKLMVEKLEQPDSYLEKALEIDEGFIQAKFFLSLVTISNKKDDENTVNLILSENPDLEFRLTYFFAKHYEKFELYTQARELYQRLIGNANVDLILKSYCYLHLGHIATRLNDNGMGYLHGYPYYSKVEELGYASKVMPYRGLAWKSKEAGRFYEAAKFYIKGALAHPISGGGDLIDKAIDCLKSNSMLGNAISDGVISQTIYSLKDFIEVSPQYKNALRELSNPDPFHAGEYSHYIGHLYKSIAELYAIISEHSKAILYYNKVLELFGSRKGLDIIHETIKLRAESYSAISGYDKAQKDFEESESYSLE